MDERGQADPQIEQVEQIEDLASQAVDVRDAEQVKGGFNPQPDPPKIGVPVFQPPVFNPGGFIRS